MVSKVQTFEEWVVCNEEFSADPFIAARQAWQAAHENAAMVCDDMCQYTEYPAAQCAEAIREAAK